MSSTDDTTPNAPTDANPSTTTPAPDAAAVPVSSDSAAQSPEADAPAPAAVPTDTEVAASETPWDKLTPEQIKIRQAMYDKAGREARAAHLAAEAAKEAATAEAAAATADIVAAADADMQKAIDADPTRPHSDATGVPAPMPVIDPQATPTTDDQGAPVLATLAPVVDAPAPVLDTPAVATNVVAVQPSNPVAAAPTVTDTSVTPVPQPQSTPGTSRTPIADAMSAVVGGAQPATGGLILEGQLNDYASKMAPGVSQTIATGVANQQALWRSIQLVLRQAGPDFTPMWSQLLAFAFAHRKDVFSDRMVYRFFTNLTLPATERRNFERMLRLICVTCDPQLRAVSIKQVDLKIILSNIGSQAIVQNIRGYYSA